MNLLITMSSQPQRDVNGTAIQTLGAKWSEKKMCGVRPRLVGASLLKFLEGFVFVSGMNALNVKLVKAHSTGIHRCGALARRDRRAALRFPLGATIFSQLRGTCAAPAKRRTEIQLG